MARERTYSGKVLGGDRSDRPRPVNHIPSPRARYPEGSSRAKIILAKKKKF